MSNLFKGDPTILKNQGDKLEDLAIHFNENNNSIYTTIEEMLTSSFLSPSARELGKKLLSYREDLTNMAKVIGQYSAYAKTSSNKIRLTDEKVVDNFKTIRNGNFVGGGK